MKTICATMILSVLVVFGNFAQNPNPELFDYRWELVFVQTDDMAPVYYVSDIEPEISPFLEISEDQTFFGEGACNTFTGILDVYSENMLEIVAFESTGNDCEISLHTDFESSFFYFLSVADQEYKIDIHNGIKTLHLYTPMGGEANFRGTTLATSHFDKNEVVLYPNPASGEIVIESGQLTGNLSLSFLSMDGKVLKTEAVNFQNRMVMDVSGLSNGIYFVRLKNATNEVIKKFVKQ